MELFTSRHACFMTVINASIVTISLLKMRVTGLNIARMIDGWVIGMCLTWG
jgi:hypothetical protein